MTDDLTDPEKVDPRERVLKIRARRYAKAMIQTDPEKVERIAILSGGHRFDPNGEYVRFNQYEALSVRVASVIAERDEARARAAAAYEEAARWHDDSANHDQGGLDYSEAVGIPVSNAGELRGSVKFHRQSATAIRALPTPAERDALDRVRAEVWEEAAKVAEARHWDDPTDEVERAHNKAVRAIAAALRAKGEK